MEYSYLFKKKLIQLNSQNQGVLTIQNRLISKLMNSNINKIKSFIKSLNEYCDQLQSTEPIGRLTKDTSYY